MWESVITEKHLGISTNKYVGSSTKGKHLGNSIKEKHAGNSIKGKVIVKQTQKSLLRSDHKLLVCLGLKDLMIIDTKDALLIANKSFSQEKYDI